MTMQSLSRTLTGKLVGGMALVYLCLPPGAAALDVLGPLSSYDSTGANPVTGGLYTGVSDSYHYSDWAATRMFNADVTGLAVGTKANPTLGFVWPNDNNGGTEYATDAVLQDTYVAFQVDRVYTNVGSFFFAQRKGAGNNSMTNLELWASTTTPYVTADPGVAPLASIPLGVGNNFDGRWIEYPLSNTISGQYFLIRFKEKQAYSGCTEFRLGVAMVPPTISITPTNQAAYDGNTVEMSVLAGGSAPLLYQWLARAGGTTDPFTNVLNNATISGATNAVLTIQNVPLANMDYQVVVSNSAGSVTSSPPASLMVTTSPPLVVTDVYPSALTEPEGYPFSLTVGVAGSMPLVYQWKFNGLNLTNNNHITGAQSNVLTIANAHAGDVGNYQLFMTNAYGNQASSVAAVGITNVISFGDGSAWRLNGNNNSPATIASDVLTLTDGANNEAKSAFFNAPVYVGAFAASFTYQDLLGNGADGVTLMFQNSSAGTSALGGAGGGLGYYPDPGTTVIVPSVAIQFKIYNSSQISFNTNGLTPEHGGNPWVNTTPVDLRSGNPISVIMQYGQGALLVTLTDAVAQVSFATSYNVSLTNMLGGSTAYIGFSGGDGAIASIQQISAFTYTGIPLLTINPGLNQDTLFWSAAAGNFALQSNTNLLLTNWTDVTNTVDVINNQNQTVVAPLSGATYYRLRLVR